MNVDFVLVLISVFVLHDMERAVVKLVKTCGQTHLPVCCYGYKNMFKLHNVQAFVFLRCCCKGKKVNKWKVTYPRKVTSAGVLFERNVIECTPVYVLTDKFWGYLVYKCHYFRITLICDWDSLVLGIVATKKKSCVEVLRSSQASGVMSSAVSLPNHTFTGQAVNQYCAHSFARK